MLSTVDRGWREAAGIVTAAVMTHVIIGTVASLRGDLVAWGSLVRAPLIIAGLVVVALATRRVGYLLLTAWFALLALMYLYGAYNAASGLLSALRLVAATFFAWGAVRLATSADIDALRRARRPWLSSR
jgi:hypothetical protein